MTEETLFHEALAKPPELRGAFLSQACARQPELRAAVEALLAAHEASGNVLDRPAEPPVITGEFMPDAGPRATAEYQSSAEAGAVIAGRYILVERIGEGGMGEVWVAKQTEPVKRKVALKLIKAGMDSKAVLQRFESERQALALMDHPHISKVLDGGLTSDRRPFFVMELVNGLPLTRFCDEAKLTPRQRLELFVPICQAVQHAHHKGIVHRDLKPSNILVTIIDGRPVPKIIDFGVAKAIGGKLTDESLSTQFGAVVGTLEYMSPEQAGFSGHDIDTRADIYSLGVVLYELLTGLRPIDAVRLRNAAFTEMIRIIQQEEPSKPSTRLSTDQSLPSLAALRQTEPKRLMAMLRGELDWVVMKCLEKDRNRRYETANGLARDIQRYLADEAVEARPPTAGYRLSKFLRRNKGPVAAAAAVMLVLVGGIIGTSIGLVRAKNAEVVAQSRFEEAESERARAAASAVSEAEQRKKAEKAEVDTLNAFRASTDDAIEQLIGSKPELGPQEKTYLKNTLERWREFAQRGGDDERSRAIRAEGHFRVAHLYGGNSAATRKRAEYQSARDVQKKLVEQFPAVPDYQLALSVTHNGLGIILAGLGQNEAARAEYNSARDLQKKLVEQFPAVPDYQQALARTQINVGNVLAELGQTEAARVEYQAGLDVGKKLVEQFPSVPTYQVELASLHTNLGILYVALGKTEAARAEYQAAIAGAGKKQVELFPAVPLYQQLLANVLNVHGVLLHNLGQCEAARAEYQSARNLWKKLVEQFPTVPAYQLELADTLINLGMTLGVLGEGEAAQAEYQAALGLDKKLVEQYPAVPMYQQKLAMTHCNLGLLLAGLGQGEAARTEYQSARDLQKKLVEQYPAVPAFQSALAKTHNNLGGLLDDLGESEAARAEYVSARDLQKKLVGQYPAAPAYQRELAATHNNLGTLLARLGQPEEARAELQSALDLMKKLIEQYPARPDYQQLLALVHIRMGAVGTAREAAREYKSARDLQEKLAAQYPAVPGYQIDLGGSYSTHGHLLRVTGQPAESLEWFDRAIRTLQPVHDREPRNANARQFLLGSHMDRAQAYDQIQKFTEAIQDWDRAIELSTPAEQPGIRAGRATSRLQVGMVVEAVAEVAELTKSSNWNVGQWYDFACFYSIASGKIADKKQEYADRAMELLQKAVKAGFNDAAHMKKDTDLDPLRERPDFKKLLAGLEKQP